MRIQFHAQVLVTVFTCVSVHRTGGGLLVSANDVGAVNTPYGSGRINRASHTTAHHGPPRGLNTWDSFRYWASEENLLANARIMKSSGMVNNSWKYQVVDEGWYRFNNNSDPNDDSKCNPEGFAIDAYGRYVPTVDRFPSATGHQGLKPLCEKLAALGVVCGVHLVSGIPIRAVWEKTPILGTSGVSADMVVTGDNSTRGVPPANYQLNFSKPGATDYCASVVSQLFAWGVGFIKLDFGPSVDEVAAYYDAIEKHAENSILLSVNSGSGHNMTTMYRISSDVWDVYDDVLLQFDLAENYLTEINGVHPYPFGSWPDFDMLPLGRIGGYRAPLHNAAYPRTCTPLNLSCGRTSDPTYRFEECCPRQSRLTPNETYVLLNLWLIGQSPLMFGGYLPETPSSTIALLTNSEALRVNSAATNVTAVTQVNHDLSVWYSTPLDDTSVLSEHAARYVALFNKNATSTLPVSVSLPSLGLTNMRSCAVRDLWAREDIGTTHNGRLVVDLGRAESVLYLLHHCT